MLFLLIFQNVDGLGGDCGAEERGEKNCMVQGLALREKVVVKYEKGDELDRRIQINLLEKKPAMSAIRNNEIHNQHPKAENHAGSVSRWADSGV